MMDWLRDPRRERILIAVFVATAALGWLAMIILDNKTPGAFFVIVSGALFVMITEVMRIRRIPISEIFAETFRLDFGRSWDFAERYFRGPFNGISFAFIMNFLVVGVYLFPISYSTDASIMQTKYVLSLTIIVLAALHSIVTVRTLTID